MEEPQADIPTLIKKIRRSAGLTQVEMATGLGITPTTIYRYEAGDSTPNAAILLDLLRFASQRPELIEERKQLERILQRPKGRRRDTHLEPFTTNQRQPVSSLRRPLLDITVLASLADSEHKILEATLAVIRGHDITAQRMLSALLKPWLSEADEEPLSNRDEK